MPFLIKEIMEKIIVNKNAAIKRKNELMNRVISKAREAAESRLGFAAPQVADPKLNEETRTRALTGRPPNVTELEPITVPPPKGEEPLKKPVAPPASPDAPNAGQTPTTDIRNPAEYSPEAEAPSPGNSGYGNKMNCYLA